MPQREEELRRADRIVAPEEQDAVGPASEQSSGVRPDSCDDPAEAAARTLPNSPAPAGPALAAAHTPGPAHSLRAPRSRQIQERLIAGVLLLASAISVLTTIGIVAVLVIESASFFREVSVFEFLGGTRWAPQFRPQSFGVIPLLVGSVMVAVGAALIALPIGVGSAIYLSEYASRRVRAVLKPSLEVLAGVPTVVYGYFALTFVTPLLREIWPQTSIFNAASASIVMGVMIIPLVASLSEDAMTAVPRSLREAAYALGATKLEVSVRTVVPSALSGIIASFILALSRAIGETMIVTIAAGASPTLTFNPLDSIQTMTAYIVQVSRGEVVFGSVEYQTIFAVGITLFAITLLLNFASIAILRRFREVYD